MTNSFPEIENLLKPILNPGVWGDLVQGLNAQKNGKLDEGSSRYWEIYYELVDKCLKTANYQLRRDLTREEIFHVKFRIEEFLGAQGRGEASPP